MDIVPGQPIGTGEHDPVQRGLFHPIPQALQTWPVERGPTLPVITENILHPQGLTLGVHICGEALHLLFNGLCQCVALGRYAGIHGCSHPCPPSVLGEVVRGWQRRVVREARSNPGGIGKPDPTVVLRPSSAGIVAVFASGVS